MHHAVALYRMGGHGGMAPGALPDPGGVNDQAAALMEAFAAIAAADAEWLKLNKPEKP